MTGLPKQRGRALSKTCCQALPKPPPLRGGHAKARSAVRAALLAVRPTGRTACGAAPERAATYCRKSARAGRQQGVQVAARRLWPEQPLTREVTPGNRSACTRGPNEQRSRGRVLPGSCVTGYGQEGQASGTVNLQRCRRALVGPVRSEARLEGRAAEARGASGGQGLLLARGSSPGGRGQATCWIQREGLARDPPPTPCSSNWA